MDEETEKNQLNELKPLDLALAEWKAYLRWGFAAGAENVSNLKRQEISDSVQAGKSPV